ncbi:MAG: pyruvate formate lyase-activating protein [Christensenellaceae bacterium]|nr:pyruvate formate lyase-activating protein [Christensenellaceae bacterium]
MQKQGTVGFIHSIETFGLLDGPGVRTIFFLQGCPLRCAYCHNPDTQDVKKTNPYTPQEILETVNKYKSYHGSDGGVTFSGGDPLLQGKFLAETVQLLKKNGINVVVDTSGFGDKRYYKDIFPYVDTLLLDVKAFDKESFKKLVAGNFDTFIDLINSLPDYGFNGQIWIRHVMVPGLSDNEESMRKLIKTVEPIMPYIERIEILPYHTMGIAKYEELNRPYLLENVPPMDKNKAKDFEIYANRIYAERVQELRSEQKERDKVQNSANDIVYSDKEKYRDIIFNDESLFENVSPEIKDEIFDKLIISNVERGDFIFQSSDRALNMYVILDGEAKIYYNTLEGKEQIYYIYKKGDFIGGHNLLSGEDYLYNAQAISKVTVLSISKEIFDKYMLDNPKVLRKILAKSFERIRHAENLVLRLSTTNTSLKVAALLLKLIERQNLEYEDNIELNLSLTREELGNYSGLTRETVTRKLSEFKELGYIDIIGNKTIVIKDMEMLKNYSM